jgi:hypothetical protein
VQVRPLKDAVMVLLDCQVLWFASLFAANFSYCEQIQPKLPVSLLSINPKLTSVATNLKQFLPIALRVFLPNL